MEEKLDKILAILGVVQSDVAELKSDVAELKSDVAELKSDVAILRTRVDRMEIQLNATFEAVAYTKEEVTDSRRQLDRHELLLGEMAKSLIEQNVRITKYM